MAASFYVSYLNYNLYFEDISELIICVRKKLYSPISLQNVSVALSGLFAAQNTSAVGNIKQWRNLLIKEEHFLTLFPKLIAKHGDQQLYKNQIIIFRSLIIWYRK